jgi:hypothetical protein
VSYDHALEASAAFLPTDGNLFPLPSLLLSLEVMTLDEPQHRDEKLNHAISRLIPAARQRRQGILVIQRDYGQYSIRVDQEVPFGTTRESREWDRAQVN